MRGEPGVPDGGKEHRSLQSEAGRAWRNLLAATFAVGLLVFVLVAADVYFAGALSRWDLEVGARVYGTGDADAREFLYDDILSTPGDDWLVFPLLALVAFLVGRFGDPRRAILMAASGVLGAGTMKVMKELMGRPRPNVSLVEGPDAFVAMATTRSPAFPSGHTLDTALIYGLVLWFGLGALMARRPVSPVVPVVAFAAWAALSVAMAFFRVLGGVHWPTDVIGSLALAVAWLSATFLVDQRLVASAAAHR